MSRYERPSGGGMPATGGHSETTTYVQNGATTLGRRGTNLGRAPTRRLAPGANSIANANQNLQRGRTLIRPDRYQEPPPLLTGKPTASQSLFDPWVLFSRVVTFWALPPMLRAIGKSDKGMQQAWREKMALCFIIACLGGFVAFIIVGLSSVMCPPDQASNQANFASYGDTLNGPSLLGIQGWQFRINESEVEGAINLYDIAKVPGTDITNYFLHANPQAECDSQTSTFTAVHFDPCVVTNGNNGCTLGPLTSQTFDRIRITNDSRRVGYDWGQLALPALTNFLVIDGTVLNMNPYMSTYPDPLADDPLDALIRTTLKQDFAAGGRDATKQFYRQDGFRAAIPCLVAKYRAGQIDKSTPGCFASSLILFCSLFVVLAIVFARFFMALIFSWFLSRRLSRTPPPASRSPSVKDMELSDINGSPGAGALQQRQQVQIGNDLYSVMLITCYSENTEGIRATVESLSVTDYPDDRKLLFLIADGIITGSGETMSTPDMCLSLVTFDNEAMKNPEPKAYLAVANGAKQYNCAKVYAGHYVCKGHKVPMILVIKCGNPDEQDKPKAGNRGKRDSQLILMNFFSRVTYNDRMSPLDYELFQKVHYLMGVTPDYFEIVLMVDADTKVYPSSVRLLVNCMVNDNLIMGLCGETKIANKRDSWVTAIQVYEYFISHHLAKGFEAVFGGVTCLPGCFCMYRLKARKGDGDWVPIITKPEIVQEYSQNTVDTLHQKNLLLLGEDRFLTTLMLRNFPYRKMVFTPQAVCKTIVPDEFNVLLSQRRRWINSTIHNLFELVLVRNLCGTFCFSMQFVIMMDLIGTLTLPVAIVLTVVLIVNIAQTQITSFSAAVPLVLLIIVLFSPALLIAITTKKWVYICWMIVYLFALPVWNFVLPVYSFWHFDDFSWGETRKVTGEVKGEDHGKKDGVFDPSTVPLRRWEDYERKRVRAHKRRERKMRELGPAHFVHSVIPPDQGADREDRRNLLQDNDSTSNVSYHSDASMHYFDPSKESRGKASSGYYPSFRPPSQLQPMQPQQPQSPQHQQPQHYSPSSPHSPALSPGQYANPHNQRF
ncbi:hypothetical protein DFQ28_010565 [Apophysomyces sp. BC1034]|nr:hypothetical protein DFQ30_001555 [Apophysomyces sp. BC1015]KAG0183517.1 hypothetical protein DFQ29_002571 [Apophysomyces sp. BC1021]KAG0194481.1 hypothetical protein DFQ28_010565 [Apophysomyces sp. BC1034]